MDYRRDHPELEFEIIALAFERGSNRETAVKAIQRYIDYLMLTTKFFMQARAVNLPRVKNYQC